MPSRAGDRAIDANLMAANKKIVELKKKILLAENQKRAQQGVWDDTNKNNTAIIADLKKGIKEMRDKLRNVRNPDKNPQSTNYKPDKYHLDTKDPETVSTMMDLKLIDMRKQLDLLQYKYKQRQKFFHKMVEEHKNIVKSKCTQQLSTAILPTAMEDDENKKLICHLENEIHRTNVQAMEAEHIKKKYLSIKGSLSDDSEKFERAIREFNESFAEQQREIDKLQEINRKAIEMRDATKMKLNHQEHVAVFTGRSRDRQVQEYRRQVEDRKMNLERLERKLFSAGGKSVVEQTSMDSNDDEIEQPEEINDPNVVMKQKTNEMEEAFHQLMDVTGATTPKEVGDRFALQQETTSRLDYLRTVTEGEKKRLEMEREKLISVLEVFKFSDSKNIEINQEAVENLKQTIEEVKSKELENNKAVENTKSTMGTIREILMDLILKMIEMGELYSIADLGFLKKEYEGDLGLTEMIADLENSVKICSKIITQGKLNDEDSGVSEIDDITTELKLRVPRSRPQSARSNKSVSRISSPVEEKEKLQAYPTCYSTLIAGRTSIMQSTSSGQGNQPVSAAITDDEAEVPTRHFLKKQSNMIVEAKSRRKGFKVNVRRK